MKRIIYTSCLQLDSQIVINYKHVQITKNHKAVTMDCKLINNYPSDARITAISKIGCSLSLAIGHSFQ